MAPGGLGGHYEVGIKDLAITRLHNLPQIVHTLRTVCYFHQFLLQGFSFGTVPDYVDLGVALLGNSLNLHFELFPRLPLLKVLGSEIVPSPLQLFILLQHKLVVLLTLPVLLQFESFNH